jgi:hypothetical protein
MPESYTPREFIDTINSKSPGGVKYDPYGTEALRRQAQEKAEGGSIFAEARQAIAERKTPLTPEEKMAEAKAQIEAMRQWLINDGTYEQGQIEHKINRLSVKYDESEEQAVVKGTLNLSVLESAKHLTLPQTFTGDLWLSGLESAEHLTLPTAITGNLSLSGLESAKDLTLPTTITGTLYLDGLESAEHLTLPQTIGGSLWLDGLKSAEDLTLPQTIGGDLGLRGLTPVERNEIRAQRPDLADKIYPED